MTELTPQTHISFAEVASAAILCVPATRTPAWLMMTAHLGMGVVQIVGSHWIRRLSSAWSEAR